MTSVLTLDERIRKTAIDKLRVDLDNSLNSFRKLLDNDASFARSGLHQKDGGRELDVLGCLNILKEIALKSQAEKVGDRAVADFLRKVESLQEQIDELGCN